MSGQDSTPRAAKAAQDAADAIRALNYATLPHEGYPGLEFPSDVYDVIGSLKNAMQRMQQALQQNARWLGEQYEAGKVGHDNAHSGGDPRPDVLNATYLLEHTAATMAAELAAVLNRAHTYTAHLTGKGQ